MSKKLQDRLRDPAFQTWNLSFDFLWLICRPTCMVTAAPAQVEQLSLRDRMTGRSTACLQGLTSSSALPQSPFYRPSRICDTRKAWHACQRTLLTEEPHHDGHVLLPHWTSCTTRRRCPEEDKRKSLDTEYGIDNPLAPTPFPLIIAKFCLNCPTPLRK